MTTCRQLDGLSIECGEIRPRADSSYQLTTIGQTLYAPSMGAKSEERRWMSHDSEQIFCGSEMA